MFNIYGYFTPNETLRDELTFCPVENAWDAAAL